jgi:hypothetical protein
MDDDDIMLGSSDGAFFLAVFTRQFWLITDAESDGRVSVVPET